MHWSKPMKYGLTGLYALALITGGVELWADFFFVSSFFVIIYAYLRFLEKTVGVEVLVF